MAEHQRVVGKRVDADRQDGDDQCSAWPGMGREEIAQNELPESRQQAHDHDPEIGLRGNGQIRVLSQKHEYGLGVPNRGAARKRNDHRRPESLANGAPDHAKTTGAQMLGQDGCDRAEHAVSEEGEESVEMPGQ